MDEKKQKILEKSIKTFEGLILIAIGIIFLCFCNSDGLEKSISYCVGTVFVIFGLFSICLSFLLGKGILSSDVITGSLITALGIVLYIKPGLLQDLLPLIISLTLLVLSVTLLIECVLCYIQKDIKRAVIYTIVIALMLALGITILVLELRDEKTFSFIVILMGITFIIGGLGYVLVTLLGDSKKITIANKKSKDKDKKDIIENPEEPKEDKKKKSKTKKNKDEDEVIEIELKDDDKKEENNEIVEKK